MNIDENSSEMDLCVICGEETNEPQDKNVAYRYYYVDGAGQLCEKCFFESNQNLEI
jgi:NMD protein affecting ribosome stability and mRNA decay